MLLAILRFEYSSEDINFMKIKKKIDVYVYHKHPRTQYRFYVELSY